MHESALGSAVDTCASQQSILLEGAHHKLHKSAFENIDKQDRKRKKRRLKEKSIPTLHLKVFLFECRFRAGFWLREGLFI